MDKKSFDNIEILPISNIAKGTVIPPMIERQIELEEKARKAERKATLLSVAGIDASIVCTIIGWLLGKFF